MFPDLDDPLTLPAATPQQREAVRHRGTRLRRRRRALQSAVPAGLALAAVALFAALNSPFADSAPDPAQPVGPSPVVVGDVPVWYDGSGLHRGDVVERTPVEIGQQDGDAIRGALALVRSGAVYQDPATGDVWFHPWGGKPRIVGRDSEAGPGGDPNGDTAAWFEGTSEGLDGGPGELVVYDTGAGREISRTLQSHRTEPVAGGDHYPPGNGFRQVSAARVAWNNGPELYSYDIATRTTSMVTDPMERKLWDVHDQVEVLGEPGSGALVIKVPGRAEERYPELETHSRLSPAGTYVLAVEGTDERHAAAIVDTRTGELWRVPKNAYPSIAWSYGAIALVDTGDELLACDAARRACDSVPAKRPFLMPTN